MARDKTTYLTGSTYEGSWDLLGMSGKGIYTFPYEGFPHNEPEVTYDGDFENSVFNGDGELCYKSGTSIKGKWKDGKISEPTLIFADGLEYDERNWMYCRYSDRRYTVEYDNDIEPAGRSNITADRPERVIPIGCYDTGYGLYDPITKSVYRYSERGLNDIKKSTNKQEQKWIKDNCRVNPLLPMGPCTFLYDEWVTPTLELEVAPPIPTKPLDDDKDTQVYFDAFSKASRPSAKFSMTSLRLSNVSHIGIFQDFYVPDRIISDQLQGQHSSSEGSTLGSAKAPSMPSRFSKSEPALTSATRKSISMDVEKSFRPFSASRRSTTTDFYNST